MHKPTIKVRRKMSERRFIYLESGGLVGRTLLGTQVIDLLQTLERHDITPDFVTPVNLDRSIITRRHELVRNKKMVERAIKGKVYLLPTIPGITRIGERFQIFLQQATLLLILLKDILWGKNVVIHARRRHSAEIAIGLKRVSKKVSVICDLEGEASAEYEYGMEQRGADIHSKKIRRNIEYLDRKQKEVILKSDYVLCTSNALKKHLIEKHSLKDINIEAFPAYADAAKFHFDENRRREIRQQLGLQDKFVLVYLGNMLPWQMFLTTVAVFKIIKGIEEKAHFLVLAIPKEKAMGYIKDGQLSEEDYTLLSVDHHLVPAYLSAADLGFLPREKHLLNKVASPGKFAEYVMCGLPVMMTDGIGDYSEMMKTQELGIVLQNIDDGKEIIEKYTRFRKLGVDITTRYQFSQWATKLFSRQSQIPKLLDIYQRL